MFVVTVSVDGVGFCEEMGAFATDEADVEEGFVEVLFCVDDTEFVAGCGETLDTAPGVVVGCCGESPIGFTALDESQVTL